MLYFEFGKVTIWHRLLVTQGFVLLNPHQHTSVASGPIKKHCSSQNSAKQEHFPGMTWGSHDNCLYFELKGTIFERCFSPFTSFHCSDKSCKTRGSCSHQQFDYPGTQQCSPSFAATDSIFYICKIRNVSKQGFSSGIVQFQKGETSWAHIQFDASFN